MARLSGARRAAAVVSVLIAVVLSGAGLWSRALGGAPRVGRTFALRSLDSLVLARVADSRVVMLGDAYHGHGGYQRLLTGALAAWLDSLDAGRGGSRLPSHLIVVLERGSDLQPLLDRYFATGDADSLFARRLEGALRAGGFEMFTTDEFETYADLRALLGRVAAMNARRRTPLELRIVGIEPTAPGDLRVGDPVARAAARQRNFEWFVSTRDSLLALRVESLLASDPGAKVMVYYGTAHLQRGFVDKNQGPDPSGPHPGFFLAHFLDDALGRERVRILFTRRSPGSPDPETVQEVEPCAECPDYLVTTGPVPAAPLPVLCLRTKRVYAALLRGFEAAGADTTAAARTWCAQQEWLLWSLLSHSCLAADSTAVADLRTLGEIANRRAAVIRRGGPAPAAGAGDAEFVRIVRPRIEGFDAVENLRRVREWRRLDSRDPMLSLAGVDANLPPGGELETYLAVQLLAVGTRDEVGRDLAFLRSSTGLRFETPAQWQAWWRSRYVPAH